jgi:hypothetical protein
MEVNDNMELKLFFFFIQSLFDILLTHRKQFNPAPHRGREIRTPKSHLQTFSLNSSTVV